MTRAEKDRRFGAAVLKAAFLSRGEAAPAYREVFEGTLRDLGLQEEEIDRYIADHREEIEEACRALKRKKGA
jgi:hypothetical protein